MPAGRLAGPQCQVRCWFDVDDGTLCHQASPPPQPVGHDTPGTVMGDSVRVVPAHALAAPAPHW
jgi:hypothetical protein